VELSGKNDSLPLIYNCQLLCLVLLQTVNNKLIPQKIAFENSGGAAKLVLTTDGQGGRSTDSGIFKNCFVLDFPSFY